jgi:hypothetical protein
LGPNKKQATTNHRMMIRKRGRKKKGLIIQEPCQLGAIFFCKPPINSCLILFVVIALYYYYYRHLELFTYNLFLSKDVFETKKVSFSKEKEKCKRVVDQ